MSTPPLASDSCHACGEPALPLQDTCRDCEAPLEWELSAECPTCDREVNFRSDTCTACGGSLSLWEGIAQVVAGEDWDVLVAKDVVDPVSADFVEHYGSLKGQIADFRLPLADGSDVHVREYENHYEVHWDRVSAVERPVAHLLTHAPHYAVCALGVCVLAATGAGRGRSALGRVDTDRLKRTQNRAGGQQRRLPAVSSRLPGRTDLPWKFW